MTPPYRAKADVIAVRREDWEALVKALDHGSLGLWMLIRSMSEDNPLRQAMIEKHDEICAAIRKVYAHA
jgi:hypothetical protein